MDIKVQKGAVGMPCDQWCRLIEARGNALIVELLGTGEQVRVLPEEVCGLRFSENFGISFQVTTTHKWSYR
jgi:hypothetical protein